MIPRHPPNTEATIPHNLGLYRLVGFCGRRQELITLHHWLTQKSDRPAIALSGEQGSGKSTLMTAAAWANIHHFPDGVLWVGPAGTDRFRLFDIVRTMDTILGTTISRLNAHRWGLAILEQLYGRRRLLILDELSGATEQELQTLVDIMGRLHESGGQSRIVLIDREASPVVAQLVQERLLSVSGLTLAETRDFIQVRGPAPGVELALTHVETLHRQTGGRPLSLRLVLGLLLDAPWHHVQAMLEELPASEGVLDGVALAALAVERYAARRPSVGPFLERLVSAAGGADYPALEQLFWRTLGDGAFGDDPPPLSDQDGEQAGWPGISNGALRQGLEALLSRALLEDDGIRQRVVVHPVIRRYLIQGAAMVGQGWRRQYAQYYLHHARRYEQLELEYWPEIDSEWGNIHQSADWCMQRIQQLWERDPLELAQEPWETLAQPPLPTAESGYEEDLKLTRAYAFALAQYAFWRHPPGSFRWLAAGAVASMALEDMPSYGWLLMNMGRQLYFQGQVEVACQWLERALAIFRQRDLLVEQAYAYTDLGTACRARDQAELALQHFWNAFECLAQIGDQRELTTAYLNLGSAYYSLGNFEKALEQHRKGLHIANRLDDGHRKASAYNNIGLVLEELGKYEEATTAYAQALAVFRSVGDELGVSTCTNNLGSVSYARQDFSQAMKWYKLDLLLSEKRGAWVDMAATLHNLGHVALELNQRLDALEFFRRSQALYQAFQLDDFVGEEEAMIHYIGQL